MDEILKTFKKEGTLHHAYLITGTIKGNLSYLHDAIKNIIGVDIKSYPDYHLYFTSSFSVDDSRLIIEKQKTKSFVGSPENGTGMRFFVIAAHSFTTEAQNGLLKVLEEPVSGNHFFILTTTEDVLLSTLRGRLHHIEGEKLSYDDLDGWCNSFINADIVTRLLMVEKFLKEGEKNNDEKLIRHRSRDVLNQIEKIFFDQILTNQKNQNLAISKFLTELIKMKEYLNETSASPRLIFEYVVFICPPGV